MGVAIPATAQEKTDDRPVKGAAGRPAPFSAFSESATALRDSLVSLARAQVGKRYRLGGASPESGFDCSGLVRYIAGALGVDVPRTAVRQASAGAPVPADPARLRPGDLVTFGEKGVSHIGIYVGNGRFVHASSVAGRVVESRLDRPRAPLIKPWRGVRRLLVAQGEPDSSAVSAVSPR
jgi:cell wall-associated NlpC family hydrolase